LRLTLSSLPAACCLLPAILCLELPRDELYERINRRVDEMFANGLIDEVRRLRALDRRLSLEASQALGYKEVFDFLDGTVALDETIVRVKTRSRNFAKRQFTWFRHLPDCQPVTMQLTETLWQPKMKQ
jgi:tRNA dimethylallyltransferase